MKTHILVAVMLLAVTMTAFKATAKPLPGMAKATFVVHCYDVGASALEGKPGVVSVERGWNGTREVDRVVYDPREVSIMQLEEWLKAADTYVSTLEDSPGRKPAKEMSQ